MKSVDQSKNIPSKGIFKKLINYFLAANYHISGMYILAQNRKMPLNNLSESKKDSYRMNELFKTNVFDYNHNEMEFAI